MILDKFATDDDFLSSLWFKFRNVDSCVKRADWSEENDRDRSLICNDQIWVSSPDRLNDPFEFRPVWVFSNGGAFKPDKAKNFMRKKFPQLSEEEIQSEAKLHEAVMSKPEKIEQYKNSLIEEFKNQRSSTGVYCVSKAHKSILQWAHYADSHRGYALGFDFSRVRAEIEEQKKIYEKTGKPFICLEKVHYKPCRPEIDLDDPLDTFEAKRMSENKYFLTKHVDWQYEEEWRMVFPNQANFNLPTKPDDLKAIVLGVNIQSEDRDKILRLAQSRKMVPIIYQTQISDDKYELGFTRLEI